MHLHAQDKELGYFNSLSIGANVGTTGWGIDIATPIGKYLALRAGITIMPNFNYSDDVDVSINQISSYYPDGNIPSEKPITNTVGNSKPFAECIVIKIAASSCSS